MAGAIGCLTDVPVGYGTPQIQYLLSALAAHYGDRRPVLVCEPDSSAYPHAHARFPEFAFTRVAAEGAQSPFWYMDKGAGEAVFTARARRWLQVHQPDVLVLTGYNCLRYFSPDLFDGARRPFVIYCALEFLSRREMDAQTASRHEASAKLVDLAIFSEENRRRHYNDEFSYHAVPQAMLYNAPPRDMFPVADAARRNGRILFQSASIQWDLTYPEYLLTTRRPRVPFDVYGLVYPGPAQVLASPDVTAAFDVRYCGSVTNAELATLRSQYAWAFIAWNPRSFNTLYACPNKLFEAIASGVPPICAPHPQCVEIIRKYDCGILMEDWSFDAFCAALDQAKQIAGTRRYRDMVANCRLAHRDELNWEAQFARLEPLLPPAPRTGRAPARKPAVLVVDPELRGPDDRSWTRTTSLLRAAAAAGRVSLAGVNRGLSERVPPAAGTHATFWTDDGHAGSDAAPAPAARLIGDLQRVLDRERFGTGDVVWIRELQPETAAQLVAWIGRHASRRAPTWIVEGDALTRLNPDDSAALFNMMAPLIRRRTLVVCCTTPAAADRLGRRLGTSIVTVDLDRQDDGTGPQGVAPRRLLDTLAQTRHRSRS